MSSSWIFDLTKRAFDVALASTGLAATWPLIGLAGVAVKLDSRGPMLYRSRRIGRFGRPFDLLKFRTMTDQQSASAPLVTASDDRRITRAGHWLRRTKIDELPQLWNVLVGDVSLVGPRPEVKRYVDCHPEAYREILRVRPGLTDRATLAFMDEEALLAGQQDPEGYYVREVMPKKIAFYLAYVRNPSLREDARIVALTASKLARRFVSGHAAFRKESTRD
jgi:lipopolysaccharide/colanic/teichoic acid biosynthesis glycosyltransferase